MFKSLVLLASIFLVGPSTALVSAQTAINFSNDSTTARSTDQPASPEARAEAKRLYKEGVKYGLAGLYPQAVEILRRVVRLDPKFANAHFALGHAYYDLKQWRNAIESFKVAIELNPKDDEARDRLGLARAMLWEQDSARIAAERREAAPPAVAQSTPPAVRERVADPTAQRVTEPPVEPTAQQVSLNSKPPATTSEKTVVEASEEVDAAANDLALTRIYRVGPNDVLDIRINDSASPQSTLFTITSSGFLEHPLLAEPLQAAGLTVEEISSRFESELKRRALVENPKVSVGVRDYASHTILVSGLIKDSGTKILRREAIPLYVVVADAQPLPEAARLTVMRSQSNETFEVDLTQASEMNMLVRPGDVITLLPGMAQFVYVGGEVKFPGEKTYRRGLTLTQAIIAAGGVTPKSKEARIGRDDGKGFLVVTRYKLKDIESGKVADPLIKPGDRIMIHD
ncbi:MAG TPA: tetratricopeptide repeat protein [Pyrinomonadaceae bacterium]|nr:tetratricopeptide repeat protein [Pyrinomonadaceae bacterium]